MAITETIVAFALSAVLHQCCVCTDESVRYQQLADLQAQREAAAEVVDEWYYEEWYEPVYYYDWQSIDESDGISPAEFQWLGVVEDGGVTYTWYSENVLSGGGLDDLNSNGRWSDGSFVRDGDGYIAVASSDYENGTVVDTPWGEAKVYDTGCESGKIDVYTSF